jgi:lipoprotein-anchoring transpeptidase ErfK/SrfK
LPVLALALLSSAIAAGAAIAAPAPGGRQELALLYRAHTALTATGDHGSVVQTVSATLPITGGRTALPVIEHRTGGRGVEWLRVRLPGRPNGRTGWIKKQGTARAVTRWRLVVSLHNRRVTALRDGRPVRSFFVVVGKSSTPTPTGSYFVEEAIELRRGEVGGPFALALSARSNVLQEFAGGPGQIAIHGLTNVGGVLGTAASHGCIRAANDVMQWLVIRIGPGVPVTITR